MGCAEPRVLSQGKHSIHGLGLFGWQCWGNGAGMGNYRSPCGSTGEGGWVDGGVSLNPGELRAKGWCLLEFRQGWKLKEFGECLRWREQQENQGAESFISSALHGSAATPGHPGTLSQNPLTSQHKFNPLPLHPGGSWFGRTSWEDWTHWSPGCSREAWPRWPSWDPWPSCEYSQPGTAQLCSCIPPACKVHFPVLCPCWNA